MTRTGAAAALAALAAATFAAGQGTPSAAEIMEKLRAKRKAASFRAEGRLVLVEAGGKRTTWQLAWKGGTFGPSMNLLFEVTGPAAARQKVLLEISDAGAATIRTVPPGQAESEELPPERWGRPFLATALTYEDLLEPHLFWPVQALVAEQTCGTRDCWVIRSRPGGGLPSQYAEVTSWIDRVYWFPVSVEKRNRSGAVKQFLYSGFHQARGDWAARQIEVRIAGRAERTLLIAARGSTNVQLKESEFRLR
jgi:hypothetical protein